MPEPIIQFPALPEAKASGLVERTMADLRQMIAQNGWAEGHVLPSETALATELGVSRTVAREALRGLSALGICDIGNGRRARVAAPGAQVMSLILDHTVGIHHLSIQQVLDTRRTLELRSAHLAALRRSNAQAAALKLVVKEMFAALDRDTGEAIKIAATGDPKSNVMGDANTLMELDIRFHGIIADASGNPLNSLLIDSFRVITKRTWMIGWRARETDENRRGNIRCHDRIAQAIIAQDAPAAEAAMREHFDSASSILLRAGIT
jgi:GntR family transcriptional regulator, transcriptional repressor for pyruvate dehydrogenase complex